MLDAYIIEEIRKREAEKRGDTRPVLRIEVPLEEPPKRKPEPANDDPDSEHDEDQDSEPGIVHIKLT